MGRRMHIGPVVSAIAAWAVTMCPAASAGQTQQAPPPSSQPGVTTSADQVQKLGISLDRIRRQLREIPPARTSSPLKLEYHVEVVGRAPRLEFFTGFEIGQLSPVQYGGMTHAEFLYLTRPPWRKR